MQTAGAATRSIAPGSVAVAQSEGDASKLAQAERRIAVLERKLTASQNEVDRLASQLVEKKGVTVANVLSRIGELKKTQLGALVAPGKTADLVADLKGLGGSGVKAMTDLLKSKDSRERFIAAIVLENLASPAAIPDLREAALKDPDGLTARMASHALALMDDPATTDALREIAQKKSWPEQVNALWGLCKIGDPDGIKQTAAFLADTTNEQTARMALGASLMLISSEDVLPLVDETIQLFPQVEQILSLAVTYYKDLGTPAATERLTAMAQNAQLPESIRAAAKAALHK
jgi:hypothetical protein